MTGTCESCGNTLCVCKAGKPREFWIELWELDENSGDTEVKNVYVKQPKHWPKKPVLQFHVIEKSAYDALQKELDDLKERYELACESDNAWRTALESRDKLHAQHVQEIEKLKQIIKDHDAKGNDCPDLEWLIES